MLLTAAGVLIVANLDLTSDEYLENGQAEHYETLKVVKGSIAEKISGRGKLRVRRLQHVNPKTVGTVKKIYVRPGDEVKKDQRLIRLEPEENFIFELKKVLNHYHNLIERERICNQNLARHKDLLRAGLDQLERIENIEASCNELANERSIAIASLDLMEDAAGRKLDITHRRIKEPFFSYITAPFKSRVVENTFLVGDFVSPSNQMSKRFLTIGDFSELFIDYHVNEIDVYRIKEGNRVEIHCDCFPDRILEGTVHRVFNISLSHHEPGYRNNTQASFFNVSIKVKDPPARVKIGISCKVDILTRETHHILIIPIESMFEEDGESYVFSKRNDSIFRQQIFTGFYNEEHMEVKRGLVEGDIVCRWPLKIRENRERKKIRENKNWLERIMQ